MARQVVAWCEAMFLSIELGFRGFHGRHRWCSRLMIWLFIPSYEGTIIHQASDIYPLGFDQSHHVNQLTTDSIDQVETIHRTDDLNFLLHFTGIRLLNQSIVRVWVVYIQCDQPIKSCNQWVKQINESHIMKSWIFWCFQIIHVQSFHWNVTIKQSRWNESTKQLNLWIPSNIFHRSDQQVVLFINHIKSFNAWNM